MFYGTNKNVGKLSFPKFELLENFRNDILRYEFLYFK